MKRNAFFALMAAILLLQPFVAVASYSGVSLSIEGMADDAAVLAQVPGTRLDDHTNHVPILIDDSSDFTSQGWPGSGSEVDPYIISGVSIHYDVDEPLIAVYNVDDYFVIRDCWLMQNSSTYGVWFANVTHGAIEYSSIYSEYHGIYLNNANNTAIDHVIAETYTGGNYAALMFGSESVSVTDSWLRNAGGSALLVSYGHQFASAGSNYSAGSGGIAMHVFDTMGLTSTSDLFRSSYFAAVFEDSNDTTISGMVVTDSYEGVGSYSCIDFVLDQADIVSGETCVIVSDSVGVNVTDSTLDGGVGPVISASSSNSTLVSGSLLTDNDDHGISLSSCRWTSILNNDFFGIGEDGVYADQSYFTTIKENDIFEPGDDGIGLSYSNNTSILSNVIDYNGNHDPYNFPIWMNHSSFGVITANTIMNNTGNVGIAFETGCIDWVVDDNYFELLWGGAITYHPTGNIDFYRNTANHMRSYFVALKNCSNSGIINNTITEVSGGFFVAGLSIEPGSTYAHIEGNIIDSAWQGVYLQAHNATITGNQILNSGSYGIRADPATDAVIDGNLISNSGENGIRLTGSNNEVTGNVIEGSRSGGLYAVSLIDSTIEDNNFTDCGIFFEFSQDAQYYNHSISGNFVNGKPFYYAYNSSGGILNGDDYGQIMLVNCTNFDIQGGSFINSTSSLEIIFCDEVDIVGTFSQYNWYSMGISRSNNVTVRDSTVRNNAEWSPTYGVTFWYSEDVLVENVTFMEMSGNSPLYFRYGQDIVVRECSFSDSEGGIYSVNSLNGLIELNNFTNMGGGIYFWGAQDFLINDNDFQWYYTAIFAQAGAHNNNVTNNRLLNGGTGLWTNGVDGWHIVGNEILWNTFNGIYLTSCAPANISYNIFINIGNNGYDSGTNNWDDGSVGNYWHDFVSPAPYIIPGSANSQDRYPMDISSVVTGPLISSPDDVEYAESSTGNFLVWHLFDDNLRDWEVYVNGELWYSDAWNFDNVNVSIDGLAYGTHELFISARDLDNNEVNDTVIVTVYDDTDPTIVTPHQMVIFLGTTGNEIVWDVFDLNPDYYTVERTTDGEVQFTQDNPWTGGPVTRNLDVLPVGTHTLRMTVYDLDGNSASASVTVYVVEDALDPSIDSPEDVEFIVDTLGNTITWSASDAFPSHYVIEENSTVVHTDSWGGTSITLNLDDLQSGYYTFVITVYDMSGNFATDAVNVTVVPPGGFPELPPPDFTLLIIIAVGAAGVVAVVAVFFLRKRRAEAL